MSQTDQDKFITDMTQKGVGIPINDNKDMEHLNEFRIWMRAIYNSGNENLVKAMKKVKVSPSRPIKTPLMTLFTMCSTTCRPSR